MLGLSQWKIGFLRSGVVSDAMDLKEEFSEACVFTSVISIENYIATPLV